METVAPRRTLSTAAAALAIVLAVSACAAGGSPNDEAIFVPDWTPEDAPPLLVELNDRIGDLDQLSTDRSPVIIVDQFTGFDAIDDTTDGVHPTVEGEAKLIENWARALEPLLPRSGDPMNVMLLGDSITDNHYRAGLWRRLQSGGYQFDFVGTQHSYPLLVRVGELRVGDATFDSDHQGHMGWQTSELLLGSEWDPDGNLASWLDALGADRPDIVTVHIGTNDLIVGVASPADTVASIAEIVDVLRQANPDVTVLIAQIIPYLQRDFAAEPPR